MNTGETKMTNITFTEKEELVLQVCLDAAFEPNMISFGDIIFDERIKNFGVETLKGVFGSLVKKDLMCWDGNNEHKDLYVFFPPVRTDDEPVNGYVDTVAKVKQWFENDKEWA